MNFHMLQFHRKLKLMLRYIFFLFAVLWCLPFVLSPETKLATSQPPTWDSFLIFGTYYNENLFYVVANAAQISITISLIALLLSSILAIFVLVFDFYLESTLLKKFLQLTVYFPRLFVVVFICAFLKLHQPSQLNFSSSFYLVIILGFSGSFFLLAQTYTEIEFYKKALFVQFALSLPIAKYKIFIRHILKNSVTLPINIAKQMRDNILFIAILPFTGVIHLQPEDLGGLIHKFFLQPDAFHQGWWILFFPCCYLVILILLFDFIAQRLK